MKVVCSLSLSAELVMEIDKRTKPKRGIKRSAVAEMLLWKALDAEKTPQPTDIDAIVKRVLSMIDYKPVSIQPEDNALPDQDNAVSAVASIIKSRAEAQK